MRIAWSPDLGGICKVESEVVRLCEGATRKFVELGCIVEEASPDLHDAWEIISPLRVFRTAILHANLIGAEEQIDNPVFKQYMDQIDKTSLLDVAMAERKRTKLWSRVQPVFDRYELNICPTTATPDIEADHLFPTEIGGESLENPFESILLTYALKNNVLPGISIPAGWTKGGLPVGLQIVSRRL